MKFCRRQEAKWESVVEFRHQTDTNVSWKEKSLAEPLRSVSRMDRCRRRELKVKWAAERWKECEIKIQLVRRDEVWWERLKERERRWREEDSRWRGLVLWRVEGNCQHGFNLSLCSFVVRQQKFTFSFTHKKTSSVELQQSCGINFLSHFTKHSQNILKVASDVGVTTTKPAHRKGWPKQWSRFSHCYPLN